MAKTLKKFELLLEVEGIVGGIKLAPAGGWNHSNIFKMKFECTKCRLGTKMYSFSMDGVKESGGERNVHVLHKCQCKNIGMMRILSLLNGHETKGEMMRIMKIECKNLLPMKEVLFDFPWIVINENGNRSDPFNFSVGVKPTIQGRNIGLSILSLKSHLKAERLKAKASMVYSS